MKQETNMEHSAEWYRGAVEALGRMVDDCDTVFDSDLPHITQGNLEDYLAEYAELLSAAEAREAGEKRGQPCTCLSHQFVECRGAERLSKGWVCQRQQDADAAQPSAAEVIRAAKGGA